MSEIDVQRRLTDYFINTQPVTVVLQPRPRIRTATGGWKFDTTQSPRDPQVMRLVEPRIGANEEPPKAQDGVTRSVLYIMIARWDAIMEVGDVFTYEGDQMTITMLLHDNGWEKRAMVERVRSLDV